MKKIYLILFILVNGYITIAQAINPNSSTEFCPNQEVTFTVTLPGTDYVGLVVAPLSL